MRGDHFIGKRLARRDTQMVKLPAGSLPDNRPAGIGSDGRACGERLSINNTLRVGFVAHFAPSDGVAPVACG